jgi:hypothetical protein
MAAVEGHAYSVRIGTAGSKQEEVYRAWATSGDAAEQEAIDLHNSKPNPAQIVYVASSKEK